MFRKLCFGLNKVIRGMLFMKTNISEKFQSLTFKGIKNIPLSRKRYHKQCERSKFKQNIMW